MNKNALLSWALIALFFFSLLFIVLYLIKLDWFEVPVVHSIFSLILSVFLLLIGFMFDAKAWMVMVSVSNSSISYKDAFISSGKYVFAKYIPGKLWIILGKAGYLKKRYGGSIITLSSYSMVYQVIGIITAFILSLGVISNIYGALTYVLIAMILISIFALFLFQQFSFNILSSFFSWLLKRAVVIPAFSNLILFKTFCLSLTTWLIWSFSFFLFIRAIFTPEEVLNFNIGLVFPISIVMGIIVILAPGGMGIREGFMVIGLIAMGIPIKEAAPIAMFSRVWFLFGELLYFLSAILLSGLRTSSYEKTLAQ